MSPAPRIVWIKDDHEVERRNCEVIEWRNLPRRLLSAVKWEGGVVDIVCNGVVFITGVIKSVCFCVGSKVVGSG